MKNALPQSLFVFLTMLVLAGCSGEKAKDTPAEPEKAPAAVEVARNAGGEPLRIAYSDWPGWVAWEIGIQKGWFKEAGVDVEFKWFEYVPSMEAFSAGKVDAVCMTNGDALVTGAAARQSVAILVNDYSNGNDMIVAKPGINDDGRSSRARRSASRSASSSHLLLLQRAQEPPDLKEPDVELVNVPTDETPQALKSGDVDAIVAWQPNSGAALKEVPGSKAIFTSDDVPGLIYDVLGVNPKSLAERRADWVKVAKVWFRIADFVNDAEEPRRSRQDHERARRPHARRVQGDHEGHALPGPRPASQEALGPRRDAR